MPDEPTGDAVVRGGRARNVGMLNIRPRRPERLLELITVKRTDNQGNPFEAEVTCAEEIIRRVQFGYRPHESAVSVGVPLSTMKLWERRGRELRLKWEQLGDDEELDGDEQLYVDFVDLVDQASAEALLTDWIRHGTVAEGGLKKVKEVEKIDPGTGRVLEKIRTTETMLPDEAALRWRMEKQRPDLFTQRVALTGSDGESPVEIDVNVTARELADRLRLMKTGAEVVALPPASGNGHTPG